MASYIWTYPQSVEINTRNSLKKLFLKKLKNLLFLSHIVTKIWPIVWCNDLPFYALAEILLQCLSHCVCNIPKKFEIMTLLSRLRVSRLKSNGYESDIDLNKNAREKKTTTKPTSRKLTACVNGQLSS